MDNSCDTLNSNGGMLDIASSGSAKNLSSGSAQSQRLHNMDLS